MAEWDFVSCMTIVEVDENQLEDSPSVQNFSAEAFVTLEELLEHIREYEISENTSLVNSSASRPRLIHSCCPFLSRKVLSHKQNVEKAKIIRIAAEQFDNCDEFHQKCLLTIYSKLTGDVVKGQRRFGLHWEDIGFQGSDPATDFRGVGLLGLYQLCHFIIDPESRSLARDVYHLSLNQTQHFPFSVMSMNITQISLQALKKSILNRAIVQSNTSVYNVLQQFYVLIFRIFYFRWKSENKSIVDTGFVLQDLRQCCKKNARELTQKSSSKQSKPVKFGGNQSHKQEIEFSNIGTIMDGF